MICLLLVGLIGSPRAVGQPAPGVKKTYKQYLRLARKALRAKRWFEAAAALKKAYEHRKHRNIQYNIALAYARGGKLEAAYRHLQNYQKKSDPRDPPLDPLLKQVQQKVGVLVVRAVNSRATIYVDGRRVGLGQIRLVCRAGRRSVVIRVGNRVVAEGRITVKGNHLVSWRAPDSGAPRARLGRTVSPGSDAGPKRSLRRLHWTWFTAFVALAAASTAGAVSMSLRTKSLYDEFTGDRDNRSLSERGIAAQRTANALWGVTAAMATGALIVAIFTRWKKHNERSSIRLSPSIGPGNLGATITWYR